MLLTVCLNWHKQNNDISRHPSNEKIRHIFFIIYANITIRYSLRRHNRIGYTIIIPIFGKRGIANWNLGLDDVLLQVYCRKLFVLFMEMNAQIP